MKLLIFCLIMPFFFQNSQSGYTITGDEIEFTYAGNATQSVYVSGNFNNWVQKNALWKMRFGARQNRWYLKLPVKEVYVKGKGFYEFAFRVDAN
ncbi:hypothetical protein [Chitinophaga tropicalis]|uniref:AMP-activated protein kinase glycogen-binding domain-containing protein n=1 Tax=Chitinophaga tropicalis TaxID=2683588 RepID=A0A7K1U594_9BACT|nr:hypothetical protein [Chitinophaga tropicalis]MVT09531.1 hypothetical protein [Chitinophaga tropicalis]